MTGCHWNPCFKWSLIPNCPGCCWGLLLVLADSTHGQSDLTKAKEGWVSGMAENRILNSFNNDYPFLETEPKSGKESLQVEQAREN